MTAAATPQIRGLRSVRDTDSEALIALIGGIWAEYPGLILAVDAEEPWMRAPATAVGDQGGQMWVVETVGGHAVGDQAVGDQAVGAQAVRDQTVGDAGVGDRGVGDRPAGERSAGEPVGGLIASVAWRPAGDSSVAELKSLYVSARGRRGGLGRALVGLAEQAARAAGHREMILWTDTRFLDAHRFYASLGYRQLPQTRELNDLSETKEYQFVKPLTPPVAQKRPISRTHHGDVFIDDYEWLRDREDTEVLEHLQAENDYATAVAADQAAQREAIFNEIKSRTQETDLSVPRRRGEWWYYFRMVEGRQYGLHCRLLADAGDWTPPVIDPAAPPSDEQVLLDENVEAEGHAFFSMGGATVSDDGKLLAYAVDLTGNEKFTLRIRDLSTGNDLGDVVSNTFYGAVWAPDAGSVYYLVVDDSWRPFQVRRHVVGTEAAEDEVVYTEVDVTMWTGIDRSADHRTLLIGIGNSEVSETLLLDFDALSDGPRLVLSREAGVLYQVEPVTVGGQRELIITHNAEGARNSMVSLLAQRQLGLPREEQDWRVVVPHDDQVRISGAAPAAGQLVVALRRDTVPTIGYVALPAIVDGPVELNLPAFDEALHSVDLVGGELDAPYIRVAYESWLVPGRIYDLEPTSGALLLRKETPVLGGYDPSGYVAERVWAPAADDVQVPLTVMRSVGLDQANGPHPTVVYGYGSYEISMDPSFSAARLSLLDRGVVYVVAHVRGGGELGRGWYEDGKKLEKRRSFSDFVDSTRYLVETGWADPSRIGAMGGSAGGLLMGAVANLAPELYAVIVAQVPFVDALTSILDPDLPLSALEWEEWGNPITDPEVYAAMKAYTPYENIQPVAYPQIAAVTSLDDTRVLFVEPAKWVARLRELTTGEQPIVFKIEMDGGHGGGSGRYKRWEDIAWDYAFLLHGIGITD